jgi:hypothetical protein
MLIGGKTSRTLGLALEIGLGRDDEVHERAEHAIVVHRMRSGIHAIGVPQ